jgi:endo-1,4-beta-xylanase
VILRLLILTLLLGAHVFAAPADEPLRVLAERHGLYVGAAIAAKPLRRDRAYRDTLSREFNVCVAENAFKFGPLRPSPSRYDFAEADAIADFAAANGMKLRGHTLVWHSQLPRWLTKRLRSRDEAIALLREHIQTVMGRYRGRVWAWDVVNEAIAVDGSGPRTESYWYRTIGPDYVEMAFRMAREADPDAILYYNDFSAEDMGRKSNAVYDLVRDLKSRGVPIDGVGWQMHLINGFRVTDDHRANARRLVALGLELSVTELDVRIELPASAGELETQAAAYRDVAELCLTEPGFTSLVTWGFTDKHSWIPGTFPGTGAALPFDRRYRPKPAYFALRDALAAGKVTGTDPAIAR